MRLLLTIWGMIVLIAAIIGFSGCSTSDDNPTGPSGDLDGTEIVETMLGEGAFDMSMSQAMISLELADGILQSNGASPRFKPLQGTNTAFDIVINSQIVDGDWFVLTVTATITGELPGDTVYFTGTDSLRFTDAGGYTTTPDSTITAIDARSHHNARIRSMSDSITAASHNAFGFLMQPEDNILVDGELDDTLSLYITNDTASCIFGATNSQLWNDVLLTTAVMEEDECPPSGTISVSSTVDVDCTGVDGSSLDIAGSWTVGIAFDNGLATLTFNSGGNQWTVTDTCGT